MKNKGKPQNQKSKNIKKVADTTSVMSCRESERISVSRDTSVGRNVSTKGGIWVKFIENEKIVKIVLSIVTSVATIVLSVITIFVSHQIGEQQKRMDYYNKKTSYFSYSYNILGKNDKEYPDKSSITFLMDEGKEIKVMYPSHIKVNNISGLPRKRKLVFTKKPIWIGCEGNYPLSASLDIEGIKTFNSSEGSNNLDVESLNYHIGIERIPGRFLSDGNGFSYYFIITYGVDGSVNIDCVWYQIFNENGMYHAFVSVLDEFDLRAGYIYVSPNNIKINLDEVQKIFIDEVLPNYELIEKMVRN